MKISEAIEYFDALCVNRVDPAVKVKWLSECDTRLNNEVLLTHEGCGRKCFHGYAPDADLDTELLVGEPYTDIYYHWLRMKNADLNQELEIYNEATQKYYEYMNGWADWVNRNRMPKATYLRLW